MTASRAGGGAGNRSDEVRGRDTTSSTNSATDAKRDAAQLGLFESLGSDIRAAAPAEVSAARMQLRASAPAAFAPSAAVVRDLAQSGPVNAAKTAAETAKIFDDKAGHRARLLTRFRDGGADALPDYEMLEMILFRAFPRVDTKPYAKALMAKFKTFSGVVNAPAQRLMEVDGIGQRAVDEIQLVKAAALRMMKSALVDTQVLNTWAAVLDYLKAAQAHDDIERFRILFLDKRNQLIADEVQQSGTVDHTPVYVREIVKRALQLGATALVLVHNHPSGDPSPSRADIDMTKQVVDAARPLGITIHDHVIVGRHGHFSLKSNKLM